MLIREPSLTDRPVRRRVEYWTEDATCVVVEKRIKNRILYDRILYDRKSTPCG